MYHEYREQVLGARNQNKVEFGSETIPNKMTTTTCTTTPLLVDAAWLMGNLNDVKVIDCSWHLPRAKRNPRAEHKACHIPGAVFFDLDECRDKEAKYGEHILPSESQFSDYASSLGISNGDHLVLYDNNQKMGMFSAPRTWYMFTVFGHNRVSVLNGGLPEWQRNNGTVTSQETPVTMTTYTASYKPEMVFSYEDVQQNLQSKKKLLIDTRPSLRFIGKSPEPVPGIKPGRIVGSVNLPFLEFLTADKVMKSQEGIRSVVDSCGIDFTQPSFLSCGTGLIACLVLLALRQIGITADIPVYDGSWTEWFQRATPDLMQDVPEDE